MMSSPLAAVDHVVAAIAVKPVIHAIAGDAIVTLVALADQRRSGQLEILDLGAQLVVERGNDRVMALAGSS